MEVKKEPEMDPVEEIKKKILVMEQLILEARASTDILNYLWRGKPFEQEDRIIMENEFLRFNIFTNSRLAILALSKLFPHSTADIDNSKYSFRKLISKIRHEKLIPEEKLKPIAEHLTELETQIEKAGKSITGILQFWRDKQIAHTDKVNHEQLDKLKISVMQYQELLNTAKGMLTALNHDLDGSTLSFTTFGNVQNDLDELISALADKRREQKKK